MLRCNLNERVLARSTSASSRDYAGAHPELEWILGGGWAMDVFPGGQPAEGVLDRVVARPPGASWRTGTVTAHG